jgi:superfamily II DNA or RNA helicase
MGADLHPGAIVHGLDQDGPVQLDTVSRLDDTLWEVAFLDAVGRRQTRMLFDEDVIGLRIEGGDDGPTFDAEPADFALAFDAWRMTKAHVLDPYFAVNAANIEPLPHQLQAVYDFLLPRHPMRCLLADDPGAGKTVMAGLYVKEALARGDIRRVLILAPGGLVEQWQDELQLKFGLRFKPFERGLRDRSPDGNPFHAAPLMIARLDQIARDRMLRDELARSQWDLAIVDEAHKMSAHFWGSDVKRSKRFELGVLLARVSRNVLLMTATPHSGKEEEFQLFLSLLDEDRFAGSATHHGQVSTGDIMRRLVKEQLRHADGAALFPERRATTVSYQLSPLEQELYEAVTDYVRYEMNKVADEESRRTVGFALLILQRRLASSPEAILQSLRRRRARLQEEAERTAAFEEELASWDAGFALPDDEDEVRRGDYEQLEDEVAQTGSASRSIEELNVEIDVLDDLVELAERVRDAGVDRKWDELAQLLTSPRLFDETGERRKIIVFTEHRDTLGYLADRIEDLLGGSAATVTIHGGTSRADRRAAVAAFWHDPQTTILLATDAAGEGVNLHCANLMVNYDLPWNPNRLEQRFGRIHRIGQVEPCHLWNLVASGTREGDVFETLLGKLETQRQALGDQVFDVLGEVLTGADLSGLLSRALRAEAGDTSVARAAADRIEQMVGRDLEGAIDVRRRSVSDFSDRDVATLAETLLRAKAGTLQPYVTEPFVRSALARLRGEIREAGGGCWRIARLPLAVREHASASGSVDRRYDLVTFGREAIDIAGRDAAELLTPGHPVVDGVAAAVLDEFGDALARGVTLVDPETDRDSIVVALRHLVVGGDETVSEEVVVLRIWDGGEVQEVAPGIFVGLEPESADQSVPREPEKDAAAALAAATTHVENTSGPAHLERVRQRASAQHDHALRQVRERLEAEITRAMDQLERGRRSGGTTSEELSLIEKRIDRLRRRLEEREDELAGMDRLVAMSPEVVVVASVLPGTDTAGAERVRACRAAVRRQLESEGDVEDALPFSGWDHVLRGSDGELAFVTVGVGEPGHRRPTNTKVAAKNVGRRHRTVTVDATGGRGRCGV